MRPAPEDSPASRRAFAFLSRTVTMAPPSRAVIVTPHRRLAPFALLRQEWGAPDCEGQQKFSPGFGRAICWAALILPGSAGTSKAA